MNEEELIDAFDEMWPDLTEHLNRNKCILTVRTAIEVAKYFGYTWRPLAVDQIIFNAKGWELYSKQIPVSEWPSEAWSLGCRCRNELGNGNGWDGHLIVAGDDWLADLNADQFDRPAKNIKMESWAIKLTGQEPPWAWMNDYGQLMYIKPRPDIDVYRKAGDWLRNYKPLAAQMIRALR